MSSKKKAEPGKEKEKEAEKKKDKKDKTEKDKKDDVKDAKSSGNGKKGEKHTEPQKKKDDKKDKASKKDDKKDKDGKKKEEEKKGEGFSQAGGHAGAFLKVTEGRIMKKVSKNEFGFYSEILKNFPQVKPYLPGFYGTEARDGNNYVVLEDLTSPYKRPCILDVKIGLTSVGEDADPQKAEAMKKKDMATTTHTLGIRITAMKVYKKKTGEFTSYGKPWGKKVTQETMVDSLKEYFDNGEKLRVDLLPFYLEKLLEIQKHFHEQRHLRFYSSSLLFLYDGDSEGPNAPKPNIKMIDFAHVHEIKDKGRDEGYITGLKNLIDHLHKLKP